MFHDRALAAEIKADPRPRSAVSGGVGLAGVAGLAGWIAVARWFGMDGPYSALVALAACGLPMIAWTLLVDKAHRRPSTGIDWRLRRPWRETIDLSIAKLAGLWLTWAGIGIVYFAGRFYWAGDYSFAMWCLGWAAPAVFALSIPYVLWLDRRLIEPKDGAWALGAWAMGGELDRAAVAAHLRAWAVKGFFLAFMLAVTPGGFGAFVRADWRQALADPAALALWLITLSFVVDCCVATVGYILTLRPLDAHIRSANPFAAAWTAALLCYPPTSLMGENGPLNYTQGTHGPDGWTIWFAGQPLLLGLWGAALVALTAIYAWATVAFGPRFSNLTNRGVITHGPYAWTRHPAYLTKNAFWWLATLPILSTGTLIDAARATLLMGAVSGIYYWRARTEERHLKLDPDYGAYWDWMERNGAVPRFVRWVRGASAEAPEPQKLASS